MGYKIRKQFVSSYAVFEALSTIFNYFYVSEPSQNFYFVLSLTSAILAPMFIESMVFYQSCEVEK